MYRNLELSDLVINGEKEIWKKINQIGGLEMFKGMYYVSNFGRIKSIGGRKGDRVMKQNDNKDGYLIVNLMTVDGKRKMMRVHRLVALAFVSGWSEERNQANHINEVKTDNQVSNLNWMTAKENSNHGTRNERVAEKRSMPVIGECVKTGEVVEFDSTAHAGRSGFNQGNVANACRGKLNPQNKHGGTDVFKGYRWKYEEAEENLND